MWGCTVNERWRCKSLHLMKKTHTHTHTHHLTALFPGLPGSAGTRKVKPIWISKQETVSGSGISWAICKSAPRSRQITTPAPHHSVFTGRMCFLPPNQQCQALKALRKKTRCYNVKQTWNSLVCSDYMQFWKIRLRKWWQQPGLLPVLSSSYTCHFIVHSWLIQHSLHP